MARYLTNPLIALIEASLPDNSTGEITPAIVRQLLVDMVESLRPTGAYLANGNTITHTFSTTNWEVVPGVFTSGETRDATEIGVNVGANSFTALFSADYNSEVSVTIAGGASEVIDLAIGVNGVPTTFFRVEAQMLGATEPVSVNMTAYNALAAGDVVTLMMASRTAPANGVVIGPAGFIFRLIPSRGV